MPENQGTTNPAHPTNPHIEPRQGLKRQDSPVDAKPSKPQPAKTQSPGINRPPKAPGAILGPYFQLTSAENGQWLGSALTLHRKGKIPKLTFDHERLAVDDEYDILYEQVFGMKAIRHNLAFAIPDGVDDERVAWTLNWQDDSGTLLHSSEGAFHFPRKEQKWRGGFFSCNGFDETVPEGVVKDFGFDNVWKHLNSVHTETPLHLMIWGGDQIYIDFIFQDIPFLTRWLKMDWDVKWKHEFSEETSTQCAEYYMNSYAENWERDEVKFALQSCPAVMSWDDHDIFDGAGSYPKELHDSPVMMGLVKTAHKFRLLFQNQTTPALYHKHRYFGKSGQNAVMQLGPRLALLNTDGRTERNDSTVIEADTWDMIHAKLNNSLEPTTQHLLVVLAVPFSFIRVKVAEKLFDFLKNSSPWVRRLPGIKGMNSIFGLPEFFDDLLDEWTHLAHIEERNTQLVRFQQFAKAKNIRVTFISGDVHCCAVSRFRSDKGARQAQRLTPETDPNLMYQIISSAIVNQSPSPKACIGYHYIRNRWTPVANTTETLVEMFERRPENGAHVRHRKVMPNRNWSFFEEVGGKGGFGGQDQAQYHVQDDGSESSTGSIPNISKPQEVKQDHRHLSWTKDNYLFDKKRGYPSTLGPTSNPDGTGLAGQPLHTHRHGIFCHHRKGRQALTSFNPAGDPSGSGKKKEKIQEELQKLDNMPDNGHGGLRVRMWLESRKKEKAGRQFASYEMVIPPLVIKA